MTKMGNTVQLYNELTAQVADGRWEKVEVCDDGTTKLYSLFKGWWKLRYVMDDVSHRAYEIFDNNHFLFITENDLDWDSLQDLPESAIENAKTFYAKFPFRIEKFEDGVAAFSWQLNPDGYYYMNDEGFGMTGDEEIAVYGFVDREMNVIVPFRYIDKDWSRLKEMRKEAVAKMSRVRRERIESRIDNIIHNWSHHFGDTELFPVRERCLIPDEPNICPHCGGEIVQMWVKTDERSWRHLAGRAGFLPVCTKCLSAGKLKSLIIS